MDAGFDFEGFASSVEQTATALLGAAPSHEELTQAARAVQEMAETALARNRANASLVACGPGCGHCCVLNVAVLAPEAAAIADYLIRKHSAAELDLQRQRIDRLYAQTRWVTDDERVTLCRPCAFLDANRCCGIYPVRPLLCRALTSIDPETCRLAIALHTVDEAPPVVTYLFQANLFRQAFIALAGALGNAGLDTGSRELTEAVKIQFDGRGWTQP